MFNSSSIRRYSYETSERSSSSSFLGTGFLCCGPCFEGSLYYAGIDVGSYSNNNTRNLLQGDAFDIVIVEGQDGNLYQNSDFLVSFTSNRKYDNHQIVMEIEKADDTGNDKTNHNSNDVSTAWFPIVRAGSAEFRGTVMDESENDTTAHEFDARRFWGCCHLESGNAKPAKLSSLNETDTTTTRTASTCRDGSSASNGAIDDATNKLKPFLRPGRNPIRYLLLDELTVVGVAEANIFLWKYDDTLVVSDIDGTITKSNARGAIDTIVTTKYQHVHHSICNLLYRLTTQPKTHIVYITSRPLSLATSTRKFLDLVRQEEARLPEGPILGFGGKFSQLLVMELVSKTTHHFKSETLWKQIVQPFRRATNDANYELFFAGFGNTVMDMQAYHAVGMDLNRIFKINKRSEIVTFDKRSEYPLHAIEMSQLMIDNNTNNKNTVSLKFPSRKWLKDRMGTVYSGYADPRLHAHLFDHGKHRTAEEGEVILQPRG
ncbi:LNS2 lipin/Ned1/Smp2 domain containing protein [Nitzschia inconspicua]|uniref:LNS2 lipin/Ned1/Smp2 domain containing protein n=1 Tax=Nitzschia inconspicua TaxID=303405 RepID=A0A9K3PY91_9STRA|nr:LNS2 lipin/Ned1/Smp2 domain containing protein [Nitzschia inconspicua]